MRPAMSGHARLYSACLACSIFVLLTYSSCGGDREGRKHMVPGLWQSDIEDLFSRIDRDHPDPYRRISKDKLEEAKSALIDSLGYWNDGRIIVELSRVLAMIGDGQTGIEREWLEGRFRRLPVEFSYFGGDIRVVAAAPGYEESAGRKLTSVGGRPIDEAVDEIRPLIPRDNYAEWLVSVPVWLSYGEVLEALGFSEDKMSVRAVFTGDDGKAVEMDLATVHPDSLDSSGWTRPCIPRKAGSRLSGVTQAILMDEIEGDRPAAVVRFFGPQEDSKDSKGIIGEIMAGLDGTGASRLIIDLRGADGGGELARSLAERALGWLGEHPGRDIVVIVDRYTCRGALWAAATLGERGGITLAGELPRGAPNLVPVLETCRLSNSGIRATYATKFISAAPRLGDSPWLPLEIHVKSTWKDYRTGYDAPLDTAAACPFPASPAGESGRPDLGDMVLIPAAEFAMGGKEDGLYDPSHRVYVDSFYIDRHEVTNSQYQRFCEETGGNWPEFWGMDEYRCGPDFPDHPVVGVSLYQARLYARWAGKRIPTEAEWELAARGGLTSAKYPGGDELLPTDANYRVGPFMIGTVPVGCYPPNGYGLYDMAGNVVEWVDDYFHPDYYRSSPYRNPKGPEKGYIAVIRGGGWHSGRMCCNVYTRNACKYTWVDIAVGFRCAADLTSRQE